MHEYIYILFEKLCRQNCPQTIHNPVAIKLLGSVAQRADSLSSV